MSFVNLHNITSSSIGFSLIEPDELVIQAKKLNQSAVALTDYSTMGGIYDAYQASQKHKVKLIIGCQFNFVEKIEDAGKSRFRNLILLAKNHQGYKNLLRLAKASFDHSIVNFKKVYPIIDWEILKTYSQDLICLTSGSMGILGQLISTRNFEGAKATAIKLQEIFGENLGLEIQANSMKRQVNQYNDWADQDLTNRQVIKIAKELNIRIVPTNPAHYLEPDHNEALDVLMALCAGQPLRSNSRPRLTQQEFYLKTEEQVRSFFARHYASEIDAWLANTVHFADQCDNDPAWVLPSFTNDLGTELPDFPVEKQPDYAEFLAWKEKYQNSTEIPTPFQFNETHKIDGIYLRFTCWKEFPLRLPYVTEEKIPEYYNQLVEEISVFEYRNIVSYMLIVGDYTNHCRINQVPVGLGRGSVGGSLVAFLLNIHQADPIKYELIFERFYNREKKDFSDIDQDFSQAGKGFVENYIAEKYGRENCCQISNFLTLTSKPYVKAIARVFQYGNDRKKQVEIGNELASFIPADEGFKDVEKAMQIPILQEFSKKYPELAKFASILNGRKIALAKHAGGYCISRRPLHEIVPVRRDRDGKLVIEYEKDRTEKHGLQKMDILGISNLDIIDAVLKLVKARGKDFGNLDNYTDIKTYELITSGNTFGVFQLGTSKGTIELCKKVKPKDILDLAMINALTRPGFPPEVRDDFIAAKNANQAINVIHPSLERALGPTFGFALFEECLMYMAQDVAGWSKLESDRLRKFVKDKGKNPEKGPILRKEFIESAVAKKNLNEKVAIQIWDKIIANLAGYSFNKSHSCFYAFLGYQTAYLKANFPVEFLTVNLNFESNSNSPKAKDNVAQIKQELRALGVTILPPDLNRSEMSYTIVDDKTILTGLNSLKFIGKDAVPEIVSKRPFSSFVDFLTRVDGKKVRAPSVCALAAAGCLDIYNRPRKQMFLYAGDFKKKLQAWNKKERETSFEYPFPETGEWSPAEKFAMETYYLGEGLSQDVTAIYPNFFDPTKAVDFSKLATTFPPGLKKEEYWIGIGHGMLQGVIRQIAEFKVKKETSQSYGRLMAKILVTDLSGNPMFLTVFSDKLDELKARLKSLGGPKMKLEPGVAIHFGGSINWFENSPSIILDGVRKFLPPPSMPTDKPQKVSMKMSTPRKKSKEIPAPEALLEEVEEELDLEGLSESEEEELTNLWEPEDLELLHF